MLQSTWAKHLQGQGYFIIPASVGHPTLNVTLPACKTSYDYWNAHQVALTKAVQFLQNSDSAIDLKENKEDIHFKVEQYSKQLNQIYSKDSAAPDKKMAEALNHYYHISSFDKQNFSILPTHIAFCIGGAAGMHAIFNYLNEKYPQSAILTPFPHYTLYSQYENTLFPLHMHQENGFRFSASDFTQRLADAKSSGIKISALLLCNPNNPLGTILSEDEWGAIINIIKDENFYIVLDEAYIEMGDFGKQKSMPFLQFIVSELNKLEFQYTQFQNSLGKMLAEGLQSDKNLVKNSTDHAATLLNEIQKYKEIIRRIMIIRSATKALSAAGERMATLIIFDSLAKLHIQGHINEVAPPPYSSIFAYANAMHFIADPKNWAQLSLLQEYYKIQVEYVHNKLKTLGLGLSENYIVQGTFYVIANFDFLIGYQIQDETLLTKLNDIGLGFNNDKTIRTDVQIGYFLLFQYGISITPLSYFSADATKGYLRITCSAGKEFLDKLLHKIETAVQHVKSQDLVTDILKHKHEHESQNVQAKTGTKKLSPLLIRRNLSNSTYLPANKVHFRFNNLALCAKEFCDQVTQYWGGVLSKTQSVERLKTDLLNSIYSLTVSQFKSDHYQDPTARKIFKELYERNLNEQCRDFVFINKVVKASAAIDYGHPDGDEENRIIVAYLIQYFLSSRPYRKIMFYF